MDMHQARKNQHRRRLLKAMEGQGIQEVKDIAFLEPQAATLLGDRLHTLLSMVKEKRVVDWKEARISILRNINLCTSWVVFENHWNVGAFVTPTRLLKDNLDAFYQVIGPDFYSSALDLSHGLVFDKDEYTCSLRIW